MGKGNKTIDIVKAVDNAHYNCEKNPENFEKECVLYHYKDFGDKLIIGKFCSIGENKGI